MTDLSNVVLIAIGEASNACEDLSPDTDRLTVLQTTFGVSADHWLCTDPQERMYAGIAAAMGFLKSAGRHGEAEELAEAARGENMALGFEVLRVWKEAADD